MLTMLVAVAVLPVVAKTLVNSDLLDIDNRDVVHPPGDAPIPAGDVHIPLEPVLENDSPVNDAVIELEPLASEEGFGEVHASPPVPILPEIVSDEVGMDDAEIEDAPYQAPVVNWDDAFPKVDTNGDGYVTEKELVSFMQKGNVLINEIQRQELHPEIRRQLGGDIAIFLKEADGNGDGLLTKEEMGIEAGTEDQDAVFKLADENGDGQLDYDEVMVYHYPDLSMNRKGYYEYEVDLHFTEYDTDSDGFVTFGEYMKRKDEEHDEHMKLVADEPTDENSISEEDRVAWRQYDIKSFQYSDKSKDGKLDRDEMKDFVQTSGRDLQTEGHEMLPLIDTNHDLKITADEMEASFEHMTSIHEFFRYHDEI
jgi:Ca2+-binding EF-hand superfamily protein